MNLKKIDRLSEEQLIRYNRHLKEIGEENQIKLFSKTVVQIGAGGLGSPLALYLTAIGIGKLVIIDYDKGYGWQRSQKKKRWNIMKRER